MTAKLIFSFFIMILPFVLWQILLVGQTFILPTRTTFYVEQPQTKNWIKLSTVVNKITEEYKNQLNKELAEQGVNSDVAMQHELTRISCIVLVREMNLSKDRYLGVDIDHSHEYSYFLTISSEKGNDASFGFGRPVEIAVPQPPTGEFVRCRDSAAWDIFEIRFSAWRPGGHITVNGVRVARMTIADGFCGEVLVANSSISEVIINSNVNNLKPSVRFINVRIDHLTILPHCCNSIELTDSAVRRITCTPPEYGNPFTRSLVFGGEVRLGEMHMREGEIQNYRNLRHNLQERKNSMAVFAIRSIELRAERNYDPNLLTRSINYLYQWTSEYGTSPERSLAQ